MAKKKQTTTPAPKLNALKQNMQDGKPISGLLGYVTMDREESIDADTVFIKVKVIGFDSKSCGVSILVEPVSGQGTFTITPCQWFDTMHDLTEARKQAELKELAEKDFRYIIHPSYIRDRKDRLVDYINKFDKTRQDAFWGQVAEMCNVAETKQLSRINDHQVKWLAKVLAYEHHGVNETVEENSARYW